MRHFPSFIDGFVEYTSSLPSPEIFRRWSAVSAISGALERKVWVQPYPNSQLYPNTYVILVGPPGVGKSVITSQVQRLWKALPNHHVASSSITKASMMDELNNAKRAIMRPGQDPAFSDFNYLSIISNELGVLIPAYDSDFMSALTDIYDGHGYSERRRSTKIEFKMPDAQFNLLAGTTPSYLAGTLPPGAWDQGFLSRTMLVFSGDSIMRPLFATDAVDEKMFKMLEQDIAVIGNLFGKITFAPEASSLIGEWHLAGGPPAPSHPKLISYNARRTAHLLKLCMIVSASESDELKVTESHFIQALDLMTETESLMPDIFKAMTVGGDQRAIEELWYFCMQTYTREKKPIAEARIYSFLAEKVPAYAVAKILEVVVGAGILEVAEIAPKAYKPKPRR
jgi:hypothetical protein